MSALERLSYSTVHPENTEVVTKKKKSKSPPRNHSHSLKIAVACTHILHLFFVFIPQVGQHANQTIIHGRNMFISVVCNKETTNSLSFEVHSRHSILFLRVKISEECHLPPDLQHNSVDSGVFLREIGSTRSIESWGILDGFTNQRQRRNAGSREGRICLIETSWRATMS
jgi:hypothetical protein